MHCIHLDDVNTLTARNYQPQQRKTSSASEHTEREREKKRINKQSKKNSVPPTITLTSDMQSV